MACEFSGVTVLISYLYLVHVHMLIICACRSGSHCCNMCAAMIAVLEHFMIISLCLFQVRNSSTLLFSALVLRIFGAKRVQDEHSIENKMTGCEFFTRFPTLHSFLLQHVQRAANELEQNEKW